MTEKEFSIEYTEIRDKATGLQNDAVKMQEILNDVINKMNQVYGETWKSNASNAHMQEFNSIKAKFDLFYGEINKCADYLKKAADIIEQTDASIAGSINQ